MFCTIIDVFPAFKVHTSQLFSLFNMGIGASIILMLIFLSHFPLFCCLPITSAAQLVLKAHKEAVNSLSGNGSAKLGTVATVVAAANSTAQECSKEIEAAMQISLRNALGTMTNRITDGPMDDLSIMKVHCLFQYFFYFEDILVT